MFSNNNSSPFPVGTEKTLSFDVNTYDIHKTKTSGIYKVEGHLIFEFWGLLYPSRRYKLSSLNFLLKGFWSVSSGKLCMVGSASFYSEGGKFHNLKAVFQLSYVEDINISTSWTSGTLENLASPGDSSYFQPISILSIPKATHYQYTLVSDDILDDFCVDYQTTSLGLESNDICQIISNKIRTFKLKYSSKCYSSRICTPFGEDLGYLPPVISMLSIQCSSDDKTLRFLVQFSNTSNVGYYHSFDPNLSLVGEGRWDGKKNHLYIVACQFLFDSLSYIQIPDCSIRLSLWFPAVWTIRNRASISGLIWTNKTVDDEGYFERTEFEGSDGKMVNLHGLKYVYTEMNRVERYCLVKNRVRKNKESYQNVYSHRMEFSMSGRNSKGLSGWGSAVPVYIGDQIYNDIHNKRTKFNATSPRGSTRISYKLSFEKMHGFRTLRERFSSDFPSSPDGNLEIFAEGVYDDETGHLCMIGCRNLAWHARNSTNVSMDCEILLNFQFPPVKSSTVFYTTGAIESKRKRNDPLYFDKIAVSSNPSILVETQEFLRRKNLENVMVLISNVLTCIFVGTQLFHVRKHPQVLQSISLVMLLLLTFGEMLPLLSIRKLLFGDIDYKRMFFNSNEWWFEVNNVITNVLGFFFLFRLFHLTWKSRSGKGVWANERKAISLTLPFYTLGGLVFLFFRWKNNNRHKSTSYYSLRSDYQQTSLLEDLRSCLGWVLDGFLLPQILLNVFSFSINGTLSFWFYSGTTLVRLLSHAYDLYRTRNYAHRKIDGLSIYANPSTGFYSNAWDIVISCIGVSFAVVIYLQQQFGVGCILPSRLREGIVTEKSSVDFVEEDACS